MREFYLAATRTSRMRGSENARYCLMIKPPAVQFTLPWSHYVRLLGVKDVQARVFYETKARHGGWPVRQLNRQISSLLFERTALS